MDDAKSLSEVMPSAVPSDAEIEAWQALPRDEQLRRLRLALSHPDCDEVTSATMDDILAEARKIWADKHGDG